MIVATMAAPNGVLSGALGNWQRSPPAPDGNPLYVTLATASSTEDTDSVAAAEWSVPAVVAENGAPGVALPGRAVVFLYQGGVAAPAAPSGTFTYTFATESLSGGTLNGWSQTRPAADANPCWAIAATALNASGTGTIPATTFSSPVQLASGCGTNPTFATAILFQRAASMPAAPVDALTYTFPAGIDQWPRAVRSDLMLATDGNIYFASSGGGNSGGTVSRLRPDGTLSVLYSFATAEEGVLPFGSLMQASDGNLYGTTYLGGEDGAGTVFKLTLAGEFTQLHAFTAKDDDPRWPYTGLVEAGDGKLYGTVRIGGAPNKGAIFRISTTGTYELLHTFEGPDGQDPQGRLALGSDGQLYGTTMLGGSSNRGVIYRISTAGEFQLLYSFPSLSGFNIYGYAINATGANPRSGLLRAADGSFYGTAYQGGSGGNGTLYRFEMIGNTAEVTVLHAFQGWAFDGGFPLVVPVLGPDGSLYGTSERGGYADNGAVWKVAPDGTATLVHAFSSATALSTSAGGYNPYSGVLFANGSLYGVTYSDAINSAGILFKLEEDAGGGLPVELTVSQRETLVDLPIQITWNAPAAVTCDKFGAWNEPVDVNDPAHITPISGTQTVTPFVDTTYVYGLACADASGVIHNAFVAIDASAPPLTTIDGGEIIGGGELSWLLLVLLAALLFVKIFRETRCS